jgi:hypothetical protein
MFLRRSLHGTRYHFYLPIPLLVVIDTTSSDTTSRGHRSKHRQAHSPQQGCSDPPVAQKFGPKGRTSRKLWAKVPAATETLASLRGGMSGRSAWKGLENGQKRKTSGQTSGHARKFPQSPEEPWPTEVPQTIAVHRPGLRSNRKTASRQHSPGHMSDTGSSSETSRKGAEGDACA